ncbi:MAG: envelope stress response membrane protein PspC [Pseudomonadota bacterium]
MKSNKTLYKRPDKGKISGVCAGISEYFDVEVWVIRLVVIALAISLNWIPVLIAYFVASWLLDEPDYDVEEAFDDLDAGDTRSKRKGKKGSTREPYRPSVKEIWSKGGDPKATLSQIRVKFRRLEQRTRKVETYVTSKKYQLQREFSKIS